jgi:hypothetical protein
MLDWIRSNPTLTGWLFGLSVMMFVGGLILMPIMVARMRPDHFVNPDPPAESWRGRHRVFRLIVLAIKNGLGVALLLAGLAMLILPGQGIITILVGISLLNFPGKRRLELWIIRRGFVLHAVNWIPAKAKRPPLILPDDPPDDPPDNS